MSKLSIEYIGCGPVTVKYVCGRSVHPQVVGEGLFGKRQKTAKEKIRVKYGRNHWRRPVHPRLLRNKVNGIQEKSS